MAKVKLSKKLDEDFAKQYMEDIIQDVIIFDRNYNKKIFNRLSNIFSGYELYMRFGIWNLFVRYNKYSDEFWGDTIKKSNKDINILNLDDESIIDMTEPKIEDFASLIASWYLLFNPEKVNYDDIFLILVKYGNEIDLCFKNLYHKYIKSDIKYLIKVKNIFIFNIDDYPSLSNIYKGYKLYIRIAVWNFLHNEKIAKKVDLLNDVYHFIPDYFYQENIILNEQQISEVTEISKEIFPSLMYSFLYTYNKKKIKKMNYYIDKYSSNMEKFFRIMYERYVCK